MDKNEAPCPTRLAHRRKASAGSPDLVALVVFLSGASEEARRLRVRLASPEEARRTSCPADWPCVIVDRCDDPARLRELVAAFEAGLSTAQRKGQAGTGQT